MTYTDAVRILTAHFHDHAKAVRILNTVQRGSDWSDDDGLIVRRLGVNQFEIIRML